MGSEIHFNDNMAGSKTYNQGDVSRGFQSVQNAFSCSCAGYESSSSSPVDVIHPLNSSNLRTSSKFESNEPANTDEYNCRSEMATCSIGGSFNDNDEDGLRKLKQQSSTVSVETTATISELSRSASEEKIDETRQGGAGEVPPSATCMSRCKSEVLISENVIIPEIVGSNIIKSRSVATLPTPSNKELNNSHSRVDESLHQDPDSPQSKANSTFKSISEMDMRRTPHPPLRSDAWSEPSARSYKVRDVGYTVLPPLKRKKCFSKDSLFQLLTVDFIKCCDSKPNFNGICSNPNERIQNALKNEKLHQTTILPKFIFAINLIVPTGANQRHYCVFYFGTNNIDELENKNNSPLGRICRRFFFGTGVESVDTEFRNQTFKLIPRIVDGNFVVKKAVGSNKPSLLGTKLKQYYVLDQQNERPRFFELLIDISSDKIANNIVKLAIGYSKTLVVDMMFLLEGKTEDTLPEHILGGVQLKNIDFTKDGQRLMK